MGSSIFRATCFSLCLVFLLGAVDGKDDFDFGEEKKTHLHFFFQEIGSGSNPTSIAIIQSPANTSAGFFGLVNMADNALTEGPKITSKIIGRAQGLYASASQSDFAFMMTMNFYFTDGIYNGSTLAILGRNAVRSKTRELSIVGGTGYFRLAQGYAVVKTIAWNIAAFNATMEYNVYVVHRGPA